MDNMYKVQAIRGAITPTKNTAEEISQAVVELLDEIIEKNHLSKDDIISAVFTMTDDLNAEFPAKVARIHLGWDDVSMLCARELNITGSLPMCIRVLIHINTKLDKSDMKHVYLRDAVKLRPDIAG